MIHELFANKTDFKHIYFNKGINIVLAEGNDNSEDSRNGLGKTTLMHIIHFCLGANVHNNSLPEDKLEDWEFTIVLDIFGEKISATRSFNNNFIIVVQGNFENFPNKPNYSEDEGYYFYSLNEWKEILGNSLFGLKNESDLKIKPSFRKLITYFVRRDQDIKSSPFKTSATSHKKIDEKICTSFCVGLDWSLMSKYKEYDGDFKKLNGEYSNLKSLHGSKGQLVPEINRLKKDISKIKIELDNYQVHEAYNQIEKLANKLTNEIHQLVEKKIFLDKKLEMYNESIKEETCDDLNVENIYNELNFYFPDNVKKTIDQSREFHKNIIVNRTNFLKAEIKSIKISLSKIDDEISKKSIKKAGYMEILNNFRALDEYNDMQKYFAEMKSDYELLSSIMERYDEISNKKNDLKTKLVDLESRFQINYDDNKIHLDLLINLFSDNSATLYDSPGNLIIDYSDKGFNYDVDIPRINSAGKTKMIIFCYDLMLLENYVNFNLIDFLIHDSNIFDGVDSRQYASALNLVHEKSDEIDMQYICMLNSDSIPINKLNFDIKNFTILELNDDSIEGSLLGFEF